MTSQPSTRPESEAASTVADLSPGARENLGVLEHFAGTEQARIPGVQLAIERVSAFFGNPVYFIFVVVFSAAWIIGNLLAARSGAQPVDPPPFSWLQGLVSFNALLLTVAVLIKQNRMAQLAEHRSHLDLQINLLTEQKVTKVVEIVDELRRDLLRLRGHSESRAEEVEDLTKPADPHALLHAIKQQTGDR
jgi:uncharacterized membrane protein